MTPEEQRQKIRSRIKAILAGLPEAERRSAATRCCNSLKGTVPWRDARAILVYLSFSGELDSTPVVEAALSEGKAVFAPAVREDSLEFLSVESAAGPFRQGAFGLREPEATGRHWNPLATPGPTLVVVPGLAFTAEGGRLGRGGGYYDRFIAKVRLASKAAGERPPLFIGHAFEAQLQDSLPLEPHDEALDGLITESRTILL